MACSFYPSLAAGNEFAQERDLGHPLQVRPLVSKWALLPALRTAARVDAPIEAMLFLIRHLESGLDLT